MCLQKVTESQLGEEAIVVTDGSQSRHQVKVLALDGEASKKWKTKGEEPRKVIHGKVGFVEKQLQLGHRSKRRRDSRLRRNITPLKVEMQLQVLQSRQTSQLIEHFNWI